LRLFSTQKRWILDELVHISGIRMSLQLQGQKRQI